MLEAELLSAPPFPAIAVLYGLAGFVARQSLLHPEPLVAALDTHEEKGQVSVCTKRSQ